MKRNFVAIVLASFLWSGRGFASCGSSSCPIETPQLNIATTRFALDLSYQYLDQNTPMLDTHSAREGEVHTHADEIFTKNKIATLNASWTPRSWLQLGVAIPYVERDHFHLASSHGHAAKTLAPHHDTIPERWTMGNVGDTLFQARVRVNSRRSSNALWLIAGAELPTGAHHVKNAAGNEAEPMLQPGSGSLDAVIGFNATSGVLVPSLRRGHIGNVALVPLFASATYRINGHDGGGYALGNELQLNAGSAFPLPRGVDFLLQLNGRMRSRDRANAANEDAVEDVAFTGGRQLYASPGFRLSLPRGAAIYGLVQFPIYQKVNGLQLTSQRNFVGGIQFRR